MSCAGKGYGTNPNQMIIYIHNLHHLLIILL